MPSADRDIAMASARSGLGPFAVLAVVLAAAYAGWCVLGARDPGDPFGAWSDAAQVAPGPPALPEPAGEVLPASAAADEDDDDQDSR